MNKIEIKNRDGKVIFTHDCKGNTLRKTLEIAVAHAADLRNSNLSGVDLSFSDLSAI